MKRRTAAISVALGIAALGVPAFATGSATGGKPQLVDPAGDANGINDQGAGVNTFSASTPADDAAADISAVTFQTVYATKTVVVRLHGKGHGKGNTATKTIQVPNGFTVTMTLSAAPDSNTEYDVDADNPVCKDGFLDFGYNTNQVTGLSEVDCFPNDPTSVDSTSYNATVTAKGNTIVWSVPASEFPMGTSFTSISAQTDTAALLGTIDQAAGTGTYVVGS